VYVELGWMSVKSHLRLAKLRFFGHLLRLPGDRRRLVKRVFLLSSSNFSNSLATLPLADVPISWCKEMFQILVDLGLKTWLTQPLPDSLLLISQCIQARSHAKNVSIDLMLQNGNLISRNRHYHKQAFLQRALSSKQISNLS
jgi:hypothetical protein